VRSRQSHVGRREDRSDKNTHQRRHGRREDRATVFMATSWGGAMLGCQILRLHDCPDQRNRTRRKQGQLVPFFAPSRPLASFCRTSNTLCDNRFVLAAARVS